MTPDSSPSAKISAQEAEVARLRHELELSEAVLRGMKAMLPMSPRSPVASTRSDDVWEQMLPTLKKAFSKGRQPGAISQQWRNALCELLIISPDGFTNDDAAAAVVRQGLSNTRPKDAAERLESYVTHEYVERLRDGRWRITALFEQKYPNAMRRHREMLQMKASSSEPEEAP
jgi:hypothetical protein